MVNISMKDFLEAGVHFGHQTSRWNPKMKKFIYGERNGIYIIDLQKTLRQFREVIQYISEISSEGKKLLMVGTKRQAQEAIAEEARRCGMFYVNHRWLGGLLTNFTTIQKSILRLKELDEMSQDGRYELQTKKEVLRLERERKHLEANLAGIKDMDGLPDVLFVIDSQKEDIAVREARRLSIPVVGVVDTNCDPDMVDYVIPGNDDALRAIRLFSSRIADAVLEGKQIALDKQMEAEKLTAEQAADDLEAAREAGALSTAEGEVPGAPGEETAIPPKAEAADFPVEKISPPQAETASDKVPGRTEGSAGSVGHGAPLSPKQES